jgi:hypothetical protein
MDRPGSLRCDFARGAGADRRFLMRVNQRRDTNFDFVVVCHRTRLHEGKEKFDWPLDEVRQSVLGLYFFLRVNWEFKFRTARSEGKARRNGRRAV